MSHLMLTGAGSSSGGGGPLALDTFTDTDGVSLAVHTMDKGAGWTLQGSVTATILSNKARKTNQDGGLSEITTTLAVADFTAACDCIMPGSGDLWGGVVVRLTDTNNYWGVRIYNAVNTFVIFENNGGTGTVRATTAFSPLAGVTYRLAVDCRGGTITATIDGSNSISYASATLNQTTGTAGLWSLFTADRFDNFQVDP